MLCSFLGGFADGSLVESILESYWLDGTPPTNLWIAPEPKGKLPMSEIAAHCSRPDHEMYILVRVDKVEEYANMVYTYQHAGLDTDFMTRTRAKWLEASND